MPSFTMPVARGYKIRSGIHEQVTDQVALVSQSTDYCMIEDDSHES